MEELLTFVFSRGEPIRDFHEVRNALASSAGPDLVASQRLLQPGALHAWRKVSTTHSARVECTNLGEDVSRVGSLTPVCGCRQPCSLHTSNTASRKRSSAVRATRRVRNSLKTE